MFKNYKKIFLIISIMVLLFNPIHLFAMSDKEARDFYISKGGSFSGKDALSLTKARIIDSDLQYLKDIEKLKYLFLKNNIITDKGLVFIRDLKQLEALYLSSEKITDEGMKNLEELVNIDTLDLSFTKITDVGLKFLSKMKKLNFLDLRGTKIDGTGFKYLSETDSLFLLLLDNTNFSDIGLKHIAEIPIKKGRSISTKKTKITDQGLNYIEKTPIEIFVYGTSVTENGIKRLKKIWSESKIKGNISNGRDDAVE